MSSSEYTALNNRIKALEELCRDILEIQKNFISLSSIQKITTTMETDISRIKDRLDSLTLRVTSLEEE